MTTPLILIAGFLGAGKTTLVRTLLPRLQSLGLRPHVILNDYQNAAIDAVSLRRHTDLVSPIAGTCICCGSQAELMRELAEAPLTPESVMLLEANGTADTTEIIEILTADRRVGRYTLPVQVTVVDAGRWQERGWSDRLERIQVRTARYLHLRGEEELTAERRDEVRRSVRELAPDGRFVDPVEFAGIIAAIRSSAASLPPRRFSDVPGREVRATDDPDHQPGHARDHRALHHFSSMEVPIEESVEEEGFRKLLESLPENVLRVKGIVRLVGRDHPVYFQRTDRAGSVDLLPVRQGGDFDPVAVLIGIRLDHATLARAFRSLLPESPPNSGTRGRAPMDPLR